MRAARSAGYNPAQMPMLVARAIAKNDSSPGIVTSELLKIAQLLNTF